MEKASAAAARSAASAPPPAGRWPVWLYSLVVLILVAANGWAQYVLWFGNQGVIRWLRTEEQLRVLRQEVKTAEERIRLISGDIILLEKETLVLEEVARRELGFVYPDEILFLLPDAASAERGAAPAVSP
ncbi:MAG: septum formation initiator family protein [Magnetococcales bacterium]|nr:septum formation initiator family protein [Magnetococcales bacterium]